MLTILWLLSNLLPSCLTCIEASPKQKVEPLSPQHRWESSAVTSIITVSLLTFPNKNSLGLTRIWMSKKRVPGLIRVNFKKKSGKKELQERAPFETDREELRRARLFWARIGHALSMTYYDTSQHQEHKKASPCRPTYTPQHRLYTSTRARRLREKKLTH